MQKYQKIKAVNHLPAGFSATRHHLNGPSGLQAVIKARAGIKCCHSVAENTLQLRRGFVEQVFPPIDSRPGFLHIFHFSIYLKSQINLFFNLFSILKLKFCGYLLRF